jgi:hypothetical protein
VLIHDAIMYMTTLDDLVAALATARAHVAPAGAVLVLPDHVTETYAPGAEVGGHDAADGSGRGLRYLEWSYPPAEGTCAQVADFAILLRERDGAVRMVHDRHVGCSRATYGAKRSTGLSKPHDPAGSVASGRVPRATARFPLNHRAVGRSLD